MSHPLLDLPPYPDDGYARLADRMAALMGWSGDLVWVQAEAIVALEAAAISLGRPGLRAVNVVTSPYGALFGHWLRQAGCSVHDVLPSSPGQPVDAETVAAVLAGGADLLALVHAESASGIVNPLEAIIAAARAAGAMVVVDAVASLGGHALNGEGLDVVVSGAQKALDGPAGIAAVGVSARAWAAMHAAPRDSVLSLPDLRAQWLDAGRRALPGMPSALEWWALEAALDRVEAEGLLARQARHETAQVAARAGLLALGLPLWVADQTRASRLVTTARLPEGYALESLPRGLAGAVDAAVGDLGAPVLRLNHTGRRAAAVPLAQALDGLADWLELDAADPRRAAAMAAADI